MSKSRYGLLFEDKKPEDYTLGGYTKLPTEVLQADMDWTLYTPKKEHQALNGIEPYACVIFATLNCVEILIKRKYGVERNYSDRFLATLVNTRDKGTTPQKCAEFLRKIGVCNEEDHPYTSLTEDDYFSPLNEKLMDLAEEFNKEWEFGHEYVSGADIDEALKLSPLLISVYAWYKQGDLYVRPKGASDNHATTYIKRANNSRLVFDSYAPDYKSISLDAIPKVAKRFTIEKREVIKQTFYQWLISIIFKKCKNN